MSSYYFNLEVITPVHIGTGSEKDYIKGLDFTYDKRNRKYSVFSKDKLLNNIDKENIGAVSTYLSNGDFDNFNNYIRNKNLLTDTMFKYTWQSDYGAGDRIKRHIQDGMGNWIVPASSLKGCIRGILLSYLHHLHRTRGEINAVNLLGQINNNLMRFIQVSDCILATTPGIYPVKIFSADPDEEGQWKHSRRGGHSKDFDPKGFVTFYEMLNDGVNSDPTHGTFRINWGNWGQNGFLFEKANNGKNNTPNLENIFGTNGDAGIRTLIQIIKNYTDNFLRKEIDFFENYRNQSLTNDSFLDELQWLKEENDKEENSCILRVGANEGWHSITGDWKWNSFIHATENNRKNFAGRMQKAYKTRKLIFDWKAEGNDDIRRFALPGFIRITLQ